VSGDYLWDGSGPPDPEVERLEAALRPLRRLPGPPSLPEPAAAGRRPARLDWRTLAAAASVAAALASAPLGRSLPAGSWAFTWTEGDAARAGDAGGTPRLRVGEWLETGGRHARLAVGRIGQVRLEPGTRVGLVDAGRLAHRLSLARGTLHAAIWAPPGQFLVDTPSAVAVDFGCAYTLEVAPDGSGTLHVEAGWVGFERGGIRSLVPAGAWCPTWPGHGPGTPRFSTAAGRFAAALDTLDAGDASGMPESRRDALDRVLSLARPRDALSLWHLLSRLEGAERARVFDSLAALVPPPADVTRAGILRGDAAMRDLWWDELGLGSAGFWRQWTSRWSPVR
jgi:hypothetical protein